MDIHDYQIKDFESKILDLKQLISRKCLEKNQNRIDFIQCMNIKNEYYNELLLNYKYKVIFYLQNSKECLNKNKQDQQMCLQQIRDNITNIQEDFEQKIVKQQ